MQYRGYEATVTFDGELGVHHGSVVGANFVISFEAACAQALPQAFREAVDEYLAFCDEEGATPKAAGKP